MPATDGPDFNGDGRGDIGVGEPGDGRDQDAAGAVGELPGKRRGSVALGDDANWHQGVDGILGERGLDDSFGFQLAAGDFDADGCDDLAIGAPLDHEEWFGGSNGSVAVLGGSPVGLRVDGNQLWSRASIVDGKVADRFGDALATADFDADGFADLAIGITEEDGQRGRVVILFGGPTGLTADRAQFIERPSDDVTGFGSTLTAGDLDGDGHADLAVGLWQLEGAPAFSGAVMVAYGTADGPRDGARQVLAQGRDGLAGEPAVLDRFGGALIAADVDGNGFDDLVVGVPGEAVAGVDRAGQIQVLPGSASGLTPGAAHTWHQDVESVRGGCASFDRFGSALASADVDGDGFADVAVGVPGDDVHGIAGGAAAVLYGSDAGLTAARDQLWSPGHRKFAGVAQPGAGFGAAVAFADLRGDGHADLVVGIPQWSGAEQGSGAIHIIQGRAGGLRAKGNRLLPQEHRRIAGTAETGDGWGTSLAPA